MVKVIAEYPKSGRKKKRYVLQTLDFGVWREWSDFTFLWDAKMQAKQVRDLGNDVRIVDTRKEH